MIGELQEHSQEPPCLHFYILVFDPIVCFNSGRISQFDLTTHPTSMPSAEKKPQTLYDKVFQDHIVDERDDGTILLYIGEQRTVRYLGLELTVI